MATIGVLPASGRASRIGGIPKFCLPISDERSLLQWHVEQMLEVCDEVRVSTRPEWVPIIQNMDMNANDNMNTKNEIIEEITDEEYRRDDIINEFYNKKTSTTHKIVMDKTPQKILHKIRATAIEQNKEETKAHKQRVIENSLKNVQFSTNDDD